MNSKLRQLRDAAEALARGAQPGSLPLEGDDDAAHLGRALRDIGLALRQTAGVGRALLEVTARVNSGLLVGEVLEHVYDSFRSIIPYDRIGFAALTGGGKLVTSVWDRSAAPQLRLKRGYSAPLEGSSLQKLLGTGHPRILNDLPAYLEYHPKSEATRLIVEEGMRSSLTCPLLAKDKPVGFLFFSSMQPHSYERVHVETFQQIAAQIAAAVEKGQLVQELMRLDELKNHFLGMASHDLRHPLTVINGYLGLLRGGALGPVNASQTEVLTTMEANARSMVRLIEDLLDVSAIEAGKLELKPAEVALPGYLASQATSNAMIATTKHMTLELAGEVPARTLRFDPLRIGQVLSNLISNAVKFSNPGTTVRLGARDQGSEVHLFVSDQGQGIPEAELSKVFTDFGRTSVRPTGDERSTGLGLAIVKHIVEAHGGRVWVETKVGAGSTFAFALPL